MSTKFSRQGHEWPASAPRRTGYDPNTALDPNGEVSNVADTNEESDDPNDYLAVLPTEKDPSVFERLIQRAQQGQGEDN